MRLSKNWLMATVIFVIWVASIDAGIFFAINAWGELGMGNQLRVCKRK